MNARGVENTISLSVNYGLFNGVEDKDTGLGHVRIQLHGKPIVDSFISTRCITKNNRVRSPSLLRKQFALHADLHENC